jgi:putative ABC transport system permease protein
MSQLHPPRVAECLMRLSLSDDDVEAVIGDLTEDFAAIAVQRGPVAARRWFWRQTATSLLPNLRRRVRCVMDAFFQDLQYGWRMITRRPMITAVAVVSLVTGITLPAVVFSLLNAVVFRPLPVEAPDELAIVHEVRTTGINHNLPYPDFTDYRSAQHSFVDLAAYAARDVTVRMRGESKLVAGELVSGAFFSMLGVPLRAGRGITATDDRPGGEFVAVVSEGLWRDLTEHDVAAGFRPQSINVNAQEFAVVGVLAAPFRGMQIGRDARIWLPLHAQPVLEGPGGTNRLTRRGASWLSVIGRLRPGVTREAAAVDLNQIEAALAPAVKRPQPKTFTLAPGRQGDSSLPQAVSSPLRLLLGAGVLVLLVAAANVASLLLARANERAREMAVRAALGARGTRLARLVVTEIMILGVIGTVLALVASRWLATLMVPFMASFGEAVVLDTPADWRVVAFVAGLAVLVTLLASLAPAVGALRALTPDAFSEGGRTASEGPNASRVRRGLVVAQFALSLSLVVACLLSARTVYNLRTLPTGFDIDHIALFAVDPEAAQYDLVRSRAYTAAAVARVSALPGVRAAGFARVLPLGFGGSRMTVIVAGYQAGHDEDMELNYNVTAPSYVDAMGIRLLDGRFFDEGDTRDRPRVAVVNETMAARYWQRARAVGQRIRFERNGPDVEIVGVVEDVKYRMLREDAAPSFYIPYGQSSARDGVLHVRAAGDPGRLLTAVRQALTEVDANVPITMVRTLQDQAALNLSDERLAMLIALTLAGAALLLAAVGLYGSMSYAVGQRLRELGVRIALGATLPDIRRLILWQGLTLCLLGTLLGSAIALAFGRAIEHRLFGVTARDPLTLATAALILCTVALVACWVPARRAMSVDPAAALRT